MEIIESKLAVVFVVLLFFGTAIFLIPEAKSSDIYLCNEIEPNIICVDMYQALPNSDVEALMNVNGITMINVDYQNHFTHIEYDKKVIGLDFDEVEDYLNLIEKNIEVNRAFLALRPDNLPAPLCLLDSNGQITGVYSVNGQLITFAGDERCNYQCSQQGGCPP